MSHPENTFKEIIEKQNKKIEGLEKIISCIITMYQTADAVDNERATSFLFEELEKVRNIES
jgi:hypothetical protein